LIAHVLPSSKENSVTDSVLCNWSSPHPCCKGSCHRLRLDEIHHRDAASFASKPYE
jgi:hypothetical protein